MAKILDNSRVLSFITLQISIHCYLLLVNNSSLKTSSIVFLTIITSYMASKLVMAPLTCSGSVLIEVISRPTYWYWLQYFYFSTIIFISAYAFSSRPEILAVSSISIQVAFLSAKLGCWRVGCCRSKRIGIHLHWLPGAEAIAIAISAGMSILMLNHGIQGKYVFAGGTLGLAGIRLVSLLMQRRQAVELIREAITGTLSIVVASAVLA